MRFDPIDIEIEGDGNGPVLFPGQDNLPASSPLWNVWEELDSFDAAFSDLAALADDWAVPDLPLGTVTVRHSHASAALPALLTSTFRLA